jgi:hypothetical protein
MLPDLRVDGDFLQHYSQISLEHFAVLNQLLGYLFRSVYVDRKT